MQSLGETAELAINKRAGEYGLDRRQLFTCLFMNANSYVGLEITTNL